MPVELLCGISTIFRCKLQRRLTRTRLEQYSKPSRLQLYLRTPSPLWGSRKSPCRVPTQICRQPSAEALLLEAKKQFTSNPEGAQKLLEEALTLNPNNYDCVLSLARLLASRNDSQAAIQRYKQALGLNSHDAEVHYELGNVYMGQTDFDTAIQSFESLSQTHSPS